jgi:hypothetical protein
MRKIITMYNFNKTTRLINGNTEANAMTDMGNHNSSVLAQPITIWHNEFVLKSTKQKSTNRENTTWLDIS